MNKNASGAPGATVSARPSASRHLLMRKAAEKHAEPAPIGEALEDSFPAAELVEPMLPGSAEAAGGATPASYANVSPQDDEQLRSSSDAFAPVEDEPLAAVSAVAEAPAADLPAPLPVVATAWSGEDEAAFQALAARRKASGCQRRGKDVSAQLLRVGAIAPNPGTVVAAIVALVAEHRTVARGDLLDAMAGAAFQHPKAKQTVSWRTGYLQGAIRDGYLAAADSAAAPAAGSAAVSQ